jgi:hypothetical protein
VARPNSSARPNWLPGPDAYAYRSLGKSAGRRRVAPARRATRDGTARSCSCLERYSLPARQSGHVAGPSGLGNCLPFNCCRAARRQTAMARAGRSRWLGPPPHLGAFNGIEDRRRLRQRQPLAPPALSPLGQRGRLCDIRLTLSCAMARSIDQLSSRIDLPQIASAYKLLAQMGERVRALTCSRKDFRDRPLAGAARPGVAMGQEVRVGASAQPQPGERLMDRHGSTTHSS